MTKNTCLAAALLILVPGTAAAQEGPVTFEFAFSNPGARSMGLGGAFTALADDATAAFANPAGLVQLVDPEVSAEIRRWDYETRFVTSGRVDGEPTGFGIDIHPGLLEGTSSETVTGLSYLSAVFPGETWSIAAYRHVWADFGLTSRIDGIFGDEFDPITGVGTERSEDVLASTEFSVVNYGAAVAMEITDSLDLGLGVSYYEAEMDSISREYGTDEDGFYAPNPFIQELLDTEYLLFGKSSGLTIHGGFRWQPATSFSVGGHYRQGPELTLRALEIAGPIEDENPPGTVLLDATTPLKLPDVYGLGVAWRSRSQTITVSLEWDRVTYSTIVRDLDTTVFDTGQLDLEDGDELHLGIEYVITATRPIIALRAGAWHEPAHSLGSGPEADKFEAAIFNGGEDQTHVSAGIGLVFKNLQIDFAIDLADQLDTAAVSVVYRF